MEAQRVAAALVSNEQRREEELQYLRAHPWDFWGADGRILAAEPCEVKPLYDSRTEGALSVVMGCGYDPGNAAYRMHTAVNECTKHGCAFVRFGHTNPFSDLRQIDGGEGREPVSFDAKSAVYHADVIHSHVDYLLQARTGFKWRARPEQMVIRHYHGTRWGAGQQWPLANMLEDDLANVLLVGARLTLCALRPSRMQWLPIAVPVKRYAALRKDVLAAQGSHPTTALGGAGGSVTASRQRGFRIAHSPTRKDYKGTADLVAAVETLRKKGLSIDLVMIERKTHGEALAMKAGCDLTFDSFWLGIQGSGLEAAAMGQMVVAGDPDVRELYKESEVGHCPYTFAGDRAELTEVLERAIIDEKWRKAEARRVGKYVLQYHDYPSVAARYESILAKAMGRADVLTVRPHAAA